MDILVNLIKTCLFIFVAISMVRTLIDERKNFHLLKKVWNRFSTLMFVQNLLILALTITIAAVLIMNVPGLKYGWAHLFYERGGNVLIAPATDLSSSENMPLRVIPVLFCLLLLFIAPFLAKYEEEIFRNGYTEWKDIFRQSVIFGLVHCIVGIPIGAGLALIIPGMFFGYQYKRAFEESLGGHIEAEEEGLMASTAYHSMYNIIIFTLLLIVSIILFLVG